MNDPTADIGTPPPTGRMLRRGATRRCPVCGQGGLFHRWFVMTERCPRCGLVFERIEGHWIGAIGINTIVSFGVLAIVLVAGLALTIPDVPAVRLLVVNLTVGIATPSLFQPFSRTLWTAIDIAMRPLDAHEVDWTQVG
ncbi:MAG: DUF983 domain-containing protein [Actinomycetota bacterium]